MIVSFVLGVIMVSSSVLSNIIKPDVVPENYSELVNLEKIIPKEFDVWKVDLTASRPIINPAVEETLEEIYKQTLSRNYINKNGDRIMLAIAYGGAQKSDLHAHRPEICYLASGFDIVKLEKTFVDTTIGLIPVMQVVAKQGSRNEPITYWIRVGDSLTRGWLEQKVTAIGYGLIGRGPDGLLFRVSNVSNDEQNSYKIHQQFLSAMLQSIESNYRYLLVGQLAK